MVNHPSWSMLHSQGHGNAVVLPSLLEIQPRTCPLDRTGESIQITELSKDDEFGAATPRWTEHHVGVLGMFLSLQ